MSNSFENIKEAIENWVKESNAFCAENAISIADQRFSDEFFEIVYECKDCVARLIVEKPTFAPYRYVAFEVMAMFGVKPQLVYEWYDSEDTEITEILEQLDKSINFICSYKE